MDDFPCLRKELLADLLRRGGGAKERPDVIRLLFQQGGDGARFPLRPRQLGEAFHWGTVGITDDKRLPLAAPGDDLLAEPGLQQLANHAGPHRRRTDRPVAHALDAASPGAPIVEQFPWERRASFVEDQTARPLLPALVLEGFGPEQLEQRPPRRGRRAVEVDIPERPAHERPDEVEVGCDGPRLSARETAANRK